MEEKEEKREEIRNYLKDTVNPVIEPLVKEIIRKRPHDLYKFIVDYANAKISKLPFYRRSHHPRESVIRGRGII